MITIADAIDLVKQQNMSYPFSSVAFDMDSIWVFPMDSKNEADEASMAVNKKDGTVFSFFPPAYSYETLQRMKEVNIGAFLDQK